jgi:aminoglycoside phosphotransferase (APT) family kinase protein/putative sterol carrier protein
MQDKKETAARFEDHLVPWFQKKMPDAKGLSISDIQKPGMGLSNETYLFNLSWEESASPKTMAMVLRMAPQDHKVFPDYHLSHQFFIMKALKNSDVPVPEMYWLEKSSTDMASPFYVMERLYGRLPQDFPSYHGSGMLFEASLEERARMWYGSLDTLARINMVDWKSLGLNFLGAPGGGSDPLDRQIAYWERFFSWIKDDQSERYPVLEKGLQWLKDNRYVPERVCLCWGDARIGNTLYGVTGNEVIAAFDWEMAFLGDPVADLAWFLLIDRYLAVEYGLQRLEGLPGKDDTIGRYEEKTGWKVRNYEYNEIFAVLRFGMILVSVLKKMKRQGIPIDENMLQNNACARMLAELLGLEAPGLQKDVKKIKETLVTVQFNLSGEGAHNWYIVSNKGAAARHEGMVDNPNCTVRATATDWQALQEGTLDQIEAWKTGRLVIEGDLNIMIQLKDDITRLSAAG